MEKQNNERILVQVIKELEYEMDFEAIFLCYDWLIKITKNQHSKHILGYDWELNSSTSQLIAKDKSACYELLEQAKVPAIEHKLFLSPQFQNYIGKNGSWEMLMSYAKAANFNIVCKSNMGTGGNEVFRVQNQLDLETSVHHLFSKYRGIVLSPYYDIDVEYRVVLLNNEVQLVYAKEKPTVIGDGKTSFLELIAEYATQNEVPLSQFDLDDRDLESIPKNGDSIVLGWQHNLGKGAQASIIKSGKKFDELSGLAIKAASAINISFASIDIIEAEEKYYVMEVNSGVMMENLARFSDENYHIAKGIYRKAMEEMLEEMS